MIPETKQTLIDIIRSGQTSQWILKLGKYFTSLDSLVEVNRDWPKFEGLNARYHLDTFFSKVKGYEVSLFNYIDEDARRPSYYSDVEYSPKKFKSCLESGTLVLHQGEGKPVFLLTIRDDRYERTTELALVTDLAWKEAGEDLLREFRDYIRDNSIFKRQKFGGNLQFLEVGKHSWDDLLLDEGTLKLLQRNLLTVLDNRELYKKFGASSKRGIILSGPPGTGKTMLGKILCNTMNEWTFIWLSPGDLSRTSDLKLFCQLARDTAPSIIFLEDLDLHFQSRDSAAFNTMLGELMNQLDGIEDLDNVIVIGTSNRPEELEKALAKRPGRFDKIIELGTPSEKVREQMLRKFSKGQLSDDVDWKSVIKATEKFTGAQMKEVVNQAVLTQIDKGLVADKESLSLSTEDLLSAVNACKDKDFAPIKMGFDTPDRDYPFD